MFERLTRRARQAIIDAQQEARTLCHNYIGTEHILLGLLHDQEGMAGRVLDSFGITRTEARVQVIRIVGCGEEPMSGQIPFTPRAKKVLTLAHRESLSLGHNYVGTEHILLGLVRDNEGIAIRILRGFDADPEKSAPARSRWSQARPNRAASPTASPPSNGLGGPPSRSTPRGWTGSPAC